PLPDAPRKDYHVLQRVLGAEILDLSSIQGSRTARLVARVFGRAPAQAYLAFRQRNNYAAIVTDGEQVGIPLGLLLKVGRARVPHVTIGHRITATKKRIFFRW